MVHLNDILAFLLELLAIGLYLFWIYSLPLSLWIKILLMVVFFLMFAYIWGRYFSPKASQQLPTWAYYLGKITLLVLPYLQFIPNQIHYFLFGIVAVVVNVGLQYYWGRGNWQ